MKHAITNDTESPRFIGGRMIPPGETVVVDVEELPPEYRPEAVPPEPEPEVDRIVEIAAFKASLIVPILPDLSDEDLARLQSIETEGSARKTVLEAIAGESLKRAQVKTESEPESGTSLSTLGAAADSTAG